ncbi:MAG TPA: S26 family signal peptidase [Streptosporangiaceae bacterium]
MALARILRRRIAVVAVIGPSMQPALTAGDRVLIRRARISDLRPGQIVVFEKPGDDGAWVTEPPCWPPGRREWMIKRVAAIPGDCQPDAIMSATARTTKPAVPADKLVVLGDNEARSLDSRQIGYIPAERLLGIVLRHLAHR